MRAPRIAWILLLYASVASAKTREEEAKQHYEAGTTAFNLTQYDEAIAEYEAAYRLQADPGFLYNMAQAHRLAGHLDKAVRFYRNYLRLAPETPLRAAIEERIGELEKTLAAQQAAAPPQGTMPPAPSTTPIVSPPAIPVTLPPPTTAPEVALVEKPAPVDEATPVYKKWWLWTIVGVVVVGAVVGITVAAITPHDATVPSNDGMAMVRF
jgi:tetratricopeptide (TPR) repeat protein